MSVAGTRESLSGHCGNGSCEREGGSGLADNNPIIFEWLQALLKQFHGKAGSVDMEYRCGATSVAGFVQQLVSCYLPHGYWFFVTGCIPDRKDPRSVDQKLLDKYGIGLSRQSRARRKSVGIANVHYLRHERFFVLLATHGHHPFYDEEAANIRDVRRIPIAFAGYSITVKKGGYLRKSSPTSIAVPDDKWRVRVQIGRDQYRDLRAYFLDIAVRRTAEQLGRELRRLPYEPYAPVRQQLLNLLRLVNKARKTAGLGPVSPTALRYQRRIVRPFEVSEQEAAA